MGRSSSNSPPARTLPPPPPAEVVNQPLDQQRHHIRPCNHRQHKHAQHEREPVRIVHACPTTISTSLQAYHASSRAKCIALRSLRLTVCSLLKSFSWPACFSHSSLNHESASDLSGASLSRISHPFASPRFVVGDL